MNSAMRTCMFAPIIAGLTPASALHAPAAHGARFDAAKDDIFDEKPDDDNCQQAREYAGNLELVLVLVDEPTQSDGLRRDAEDELRGNQGPPRKGPADLEPDENTSNRRQ